MISVPVIKVYKAGNEVRLREIEERVHDEDPGLVPLLALVGVQAPQLRALDLTANIDESSYFCCWTSIQQLYELSIHGPWTFLHRFHYHIAPKRGLPMDQLTIQTPKHLFSYH